MEFSNSKSRSRNVPSFSPNSYITKRQKVGLMMLDYYNPSEEAPILFKTRNATKSIAALPKSAVDSKGKSLADESETPTTILLPKPCLVSSNYLNSPNHSLNVRVGSGSQRPNPIDINPVPLTTCVKHGTSGFLPLDYARRFPEYTCTIHKFPVAKVIHGFDDCVLEFPDDQTAISSPTWRHYEQDIIDVNVKKCCRCNKKLSDKKDIFMYRDNMYCSEECRYEECADPSSSGDQGSRSTSNHVSSMDGDTIFTIDLC